LGVTAIPALWLASRGWAGEDRPFELLDLPEARWREILSREQYRVLRREGTEPAFPVR
jgi:peptide-methionine (R)-S-oxide reductase